MAPQGTSNDLHNLATVVIKQYAEPKKNLIRQKTVIRNWWTDMKVTT